MCVCMCIQLNEGIMSDRSNENKNCLENQIFKVVIGEQVKKHNQRKNSGRKREIASSNTLNKYIQII